MKASLVGEDMVQPGGETQVEVTIGTGGRSGKIAKAISVQTDHPDHANVSLKLEVNVVVELDFAEAVARFQNIKVGETQEQVIAFTAEKPASVKFGPVKTVGEGFSAKIAKSAAGGWQIKVVATPTKTGPLSGTVEVELLEPEAKNLKIHVTGRVKGDIEVNPAQVMLRKKAPDDKAKANIKLTSEKKFSVKGVADGEGMFDVEVKAITEGTEYQLVVTLTDKGMEQERFGSNLVVKTSLATQPKFEIPVYVMTVTPPKTK